MKYYISFTEPTVEPNKNWAHKNFLLVWISFANSQQINHSFEDKQALCKNINNLTIPGLQDVTGSQNNIFSNEIYDSNLMGLG